MTQYSNKIICNLQAGIPDYRKAKKEMRSEHNRQLSNKSKPIPSGTKLKSKETTNSLTKNKEYVLLDHFCTLVSTVYYSEWYQFVTLKNDYGWTVKVNLKKFYSKPELDQMVIDNYLIE